MDTLRKLKNVIPVLLLAPIPQTPLPTGPIDAARDVAIWLLQLVAAGLLIMFAVILFRTGRNAQRKIEDNYVQDRPIGESIKTFGAWLVIAVLLIAVVFVPDAIMDREMTFRGMLDFVINWFSSAFAGFSA